MANVISTSNPQNCSIQNIKHEAITERLARKEVIYNVSCLVKELFNQEKYFEELSEFLGEEDDEGNIPEVFEYWIVTPWLGEKLKAHGELVTEFLNLDIWGRQTTGQSICLDAVIDDIAMEISAS